LSKTPSFRSFTLPSIRLATRIVVSLTLLATSSVQAGGESAPGGPPPMRASDLPGLPALAAPAPAAATLSGTVLEVLEVPGYTYVRVSPKAGAAGAEGEEAAAETWLAGPQTVLRVGSVVAWPAGMTMRNFQSKALGRSFDSIDFVDRLEILSGAPADGDHAVDPHGALREAPAVEVTGIEKAEGGVTIAELRDGRAGLEGREVVVRGKVVKFNAAIMDRNWMHLRDGSRGTDGSDDLTVTTEDVAKVGDTVVVRGRLVLGKDFGFGYRYDVLVEGASATVE